MDEALPEQLNQQALEKFKTVLTKIQPGKNDSLSFFVHLKIGILEHYFGQLISGVKGKTITGKIGCFIIATIGK
ncbi:MAG: hypothetical protein C4308_07325 [Chitinophagaceae bacterium]